MPHPLALAGDHVRSHGSAEGDTWAPPLLTYPFPRDATDRRPTTANGEASHPRARGTLTQAASPRPSNPNIDRDDVEAAVAHHGFPLTRILTSEDARSYKLRPELFRSALELAGLPSSSAVCVGDSLSADIAGAAEVGIRSVWVDRRGRRSTTGSAIEPTATTRVSDLTEALALVTGQVAGAS